MNLEKAMKKTLFSMIVCMMIAGAVPASAQTKQEATDPCLVLSEIAGMVMLNRQNGTSMSKLMQIADGNALFEEIIILAYDEPRFSTDSNKRNAVLDFRNEVEHACYSNR